MELAQAAALAVATYTLTGLAFALYFAMSGAARLDPSASGASLGARLIWMPAATALWPVLLRRCLRATDPLKRSEHPS
ncbi:MAG: hypothetical protein SGJ09_01750 [Phycisphaerae bacterium]|nr:hypothetical protein [Phycisphaerae bacterium]